LADAFRTFLIGSDKKERAQGGRSWAQ